MPAPDEVAAAVDAATLTPIVRRALDSETAELTGWQLAYFVLDRADEARELLEDA